MKNPAFFTSRERLETEIRRLDLDIPLEPEILEALKPAKIGSRTVGNRFAIHPMEGCDGTADGRPDELTWHRWGRFARGGAKILWGEAIAILPDARANRRQLLLSEKTLPDVTRLISFAREEHRKACGKTEDFLVGLQLTHSGRFSHESPKILFHDPALDKDARHPVLSDADLDRILDAYVAAAKLAHHAGVDFVDIKQCHRYLLSEMLAARTRSGRYGGSLENRTRFARTLFRRIHDEVSKDLILASRMNCFDGVPHGTKRPGLPGFGCREDRPEEPDLTEPIEAVRLFREAGLQLLNVTAGCPYFNFHVGRPADTAPLDGYELPEPGLVGVARHFDLAAGIQKAFPELPVVGTGYSYLRHYLAMAAEGNIRAGRVSFAGVGRGALAYPDFVRDLVKTGRMEKLKVCITVSHCTNLMRAKGNELGQYAAGCVPRDRVYAKLFQEARKSP